MVAPDHNICGRTGLLRKNIHFCRETSGPQDKGVVAATLGLSHFVDDKDENLWSVYSDPAGGGLAKDHLKWTATLGLMQFASFRNEPLLQFYVSTSKMLVK